MRNNSIQDLHSYKIQMPSHSQALTNASSMTASHQPETDQEVPDHIEPQSSPVESRLHFSFSLYICTYYTVEDTCNL